MLASAEFWVAVAFFLFMGLLAYYGVPGVVAKALDKRAADIRKDLEDARKLKEEAQALLADYERRRKAADTEAQAIIDQAKQEATALATETRTNLKDMLARRARLAEEKIARAEQQAVAEVRTAAIDAAVAASERLIAGKVDGSLAGSLVDKSIRELTAKLS
jgi:F-type H+-transporting ATPase subunit b